MTDTLKDDIAPLLDPTELAGTADASIAAEFAARDALDALEDSDAEEASPADLDDLPLDGN